MNGAVPEYEVFAIRYATREANRSEHFIGGDPHDGPMPMDYFVWLVRGEGRAIIVDSGFTAAMAAKRRRTFLRCPVDALALFDVHAESISDVVLTHLHYDHVGNFHRFPRADFHLQEPELHYAVGRHMRYPVLARPFEVDEVVGIVRLNYARRVRLYSGVAELAPGITLHPAPGHSVGLQFVRVNTRRGPVVLASDATHFYENFLSGRPYTTVFSVGDMLESFERLIAAAPSLAHIVPGHDPLVMQRYPTPSPELKSIAVHLDVDPAEA
jgi:glyoxylase-like metal-dependent hydrolase (beta-lactamase superfamily II)